MSTLEPTLAELRALVGIGTIPARRLLRLHDVIALTMVPLVPAMIAVWFISVDSSQQALLIAVAAWTIVTGLIIFVVKRVARHNSPSIQIGKQVLAPGEATDVEVAFRRAPRRPGLRLLCREMLTGESALGTGTTTKFRTLHDERIPVSWSTPTRLLGRVLMPKNVDEIEGDDRRPASMRFQRTVHWRLELTSGLWPRLDILQLDVAEHEVSSRRELRVPATPSQQLDDARGRCPGCTRPLTDDSCSACGIDVMGAQQLASVLERLSLGLDDWRTLIGEQGLPSSWRCPGCGSALKRVPLKGTMVDVCGSCGTGVFERGEALRIQQTIESEPTRA